MINNAITLKYKKASNNTKKQINIDGKQILRNREVLNRLEINGENNSFITLKDHKENFNSNPTVRLINPAKNELGNISRAILDTTNKSIREAMGLNQWRNTDTVTDWFKSIRNKHLCKFVVFDIKEFCPYITENQLKKTLTFAEAHTHLSDDDKAIIHHARKSLLLNDQQTWIKRDSGLFDVTMGAYDGAEVCELVGTYLLYEIAKLYEKKDIGLYRDDGLAVFKNKSGPKPEKIKKSIQAIFRENELKITIQCYLKIVDYLDAIFNLTDSSYRPFSKTNNEINFIHKQSNHPPSIIYL